MPDPHCPLAERKCWCPLIAPITQVKNARICKATQAVVETVEMEVLLARLLLEQAVNTAVANHNIKHLDFMPLLGLPLRVAPHQVVVVARVVAVPDTETGTQWLLEGRLHRPNNTFNKTHNHNLRMADKMWHKLRKIPMHHKPLCVKIWGRLDCVLCFVLM